jgi:hypothetical protein
MEIDNQTEATMQTAFTHRTAIGRQQARETRLRLSAGRTLRRLQAAIVSGSDHPCWRQVDAATSMALRSDRERELLLDAGLVPDHR